MLAQRAYKAIAIHTRVAQLVRGKNLAHVGTEGEERQPGVPDDSENPHAISTAAVQRESRNKRFVYSDLRFESLVIIAHDHAVFPIQAVRRAHRGRREERITQDLLRRKDRVSCFNRESSVDDPSNAGGRCVPAPYGIGYLHRGWTGLECRPAIVCFDSRSSTGDEEPANAELVRDVSIFVDSVSKSIDRSAYHFGELARIDLQDLGRFLEGPPRLRAGGIEYDGDVSLVGRPYEPGVTIVSLALHGRS